MSGAPCQLSALFLSAAAFRIVPVSMLVDRKHLYSGKIVELIVDTVNIKGEDHVREVVRHPGGVVILAELPDGRIPFVRQLRYPMNQVLLELPAGKLNRGEEPAVSAARELEEETGFRAISLKPVFSYYPTPGFCDELLHFFYTDELQQGSPNLEPDEDITVEFYRLEEALEMTTDGRINDGKTLLGLLWLDRLRRT